MMVRLGKAALSARLSRMPEPNPSGWAGIQDYMISHDDASMGDYMDDIDTMLVFAALFSAVVTTFVVETYPSLRGDSATTTNQLLAFQISSENHPNIPSTINSTIANLLAPQPLGPPASMQWINALFFLSLVFSLAAALLGIMAKQWIREFLKWDSALATPRENVLVRQIRIESWEKWRVEGLLWAIPIILELAMILFLAGVAVLLWTLDDAVAKAITVVVAVFLSVVAALTVLPVFFKRCPYKSPTSWVLLRSSILVKNSIIALLSHIGPSVVAKRMSTLQRKLSEQVISSWRDWDLDLCGNSSLGGSSWPWSPSAAAHAIVEVNKEEDELPLLPTDDKIDSGLWIRATRDTLSSLHESVLETSTLVRALSWARQSAQDERVEQYIDQCILSIHTPRPPTPFIDAVQLRTITDWCIMAALHDDNKLSNPQLLLTASLAKSKWGTIGIQSIVDIREAAGVREIRLPDYRYKLCLETDTLKPRSEFFSNLYKLWKPPHRHRVDIFLRLLFADLYHAMANDSFQAGQSLGAVGHGWLHAPLQLRRVAEIISVLYQLTPLVTADYALRGIIGREIHLAAIRAVVCADTYTRIQLAFSAPKLRYMAFRIACAQASVSVDSKMNLVIEPGYTHYGQFLFLIVRHFNTQPASWRHDDLNMFIFCVKHWLSPVFPSVPSSADLSQILNKLRGAVSLLISNRDFEIYRDCGGAESEAADWISMSSKLHNIISRYRDQKTTAVFRDLLHTLVYAYRHLDFVDPTSGLWAKYLHHNLCETHALMPCSNSACPWNSHICDDPTTCKLVAKTSPASKPYSAPRPVRLDMECQHEDVPLLHRTRHLLYGCFRWLNLGPVLSVRGGLGTRPASPLSIAETGDSQSLTTNRRRGARVKLTELIALIRRAYGPITRYDREVILEAPRQAAIHSPRSPESDTASNATTDGRGKSRMQELVALPELPLASDSPSDHTVPASSPVDVVGLNVPPTESIGNNITIYCPARAYDSYDLARLWSRKTVLHLPT